MEDKILETRHPPLSTSTTSTPLSHSSISDDAAANTPVVMNGSEQHYPPLQQQPLQQQSSQQQPSQQTTALFDKSRPSTPFDWQLLPQEDLDRIAYNSHRQRKARLRENPPTCVHCPESRFTSMSMLSAHNLSRRHLARVRRQEQRCVQRQDTKRRVIQSKLTTSTLDTRAIIAGNSQSCSDALKMVVTQVIPNNPVQPSRVGSTATQRKRKLERNWKKARARLTKQLDSTTTRQTPNAAMLIEKDGEKGRSTKTASASTLESAPHCDHNGYETSTAPSGVALQSIRTDPSHQSTTVSDTAGTASLSLNTTQNRQQEQQQQQQQQQHWHCSICGSSWRQEKAWKGHLLSAQHLRHTHTIMQQVAPDIRPYGRSDVLSSMDPFGWGTAAGVEEEEEDEDDEEYGDDDKEDDHVINDDDMDLSD